MKYNLLCFQISGKLLFVATKHNYEVSTSLMKENKRLKRLKTVKWISVWKLVPDLLLTVRSARMRVSAELNEAEKCNCTSKPRRV